MRTGLPGWLIIVFLVAGIGCSDKNSLPSGILPREAMQNVLWDMIQADQFSTYLAKDSARVNLKMENLRLYEQVFQLNHVSREEFKKSYKYYLDHPDLSQTLFDSLLAMGNRLRTENYNRPMTRTAITPPLTVIPPGGADSLKKKPLILPRRLPQQPPVRHPSSTPKAKLPEP